MTQLIIVLGLAYVVLREVKGPIEEGVETISSVIGSVSDALGPTEEERKKDALSNVASSNEVLLFWRQWEKTIRTVTNGIKDVSAELVGAIMYQESKGNVLSVGLANEQGLMQLKPGAVEDVNVFFNRSFVYNDYVGSSDNNILNNIQIGALYYYLQLKRAKNEYDALGSYNQGFKGYTTDVEAREKGRNYADAVLGVKNLITTLQ